MRKSNKGWHAVDLDRTLAKAKDTHSETDIGPPIPEMVERVKGWLDKGENVKIFTARVANPENREKVVQAIMDWCIEHFGEAFDVTNKKDENTIDIWDDIARQVVPNTGKRR